MVSPSSLRIDSVARVEHSLGIELLLVSLSELELLLESVSLLDLLKHLVPIPNFKLQNCSIF